MNLTDKSKLLCVEDEIEWQEEVKRASNNTHDVIVDVADNFELAKKYLNNGCYDLCTLDSRLDKNTDEPRIGRLIKYAKNYLQIDAPLVVLTNWGDDVTKMHKNQIYNIIIKSECQDNPSILKNSILDAVHYSLRKQGIKLIKNVPNHCLLYKSDEEIINNLNNISTQEHNDYASYAKSLKNRLCKHIRRPDYNLEILFETIGHIEKLDEKDVEVSMRMPSGDYLKRLFSANRIKAADLYYVDAFFCYTVMSRGAEVISTLKKDNSNEPSEKFRNLDEIEENIFNEYKLEDKNNSE